MRNINGIKGLDKIFLGGSTILVHQIHPKIRKGLDPITNFEIQKLNHQTLNFYHIFVRFSFKKAP
jgi:hypothetical protein